MTTAPERYARNDQEIAADVVDGEAVIINLANGTYYSLDQVATLVWEMTATPRTREAIAAEIAARYEVPAAQAHADVGALLVELLHEQLVIQLPCEETGEGAAPADHSPKSTYTTPRLSKYTDMADMLALDPPLPGFKDIPWKTPAGE